MGETPVRAKKLAVAASVAVVAAVGITPLAQAGEDGGKQAGHRSGSSAGSGADSSREMQLHFTGRNIAIQAESNTTSKVVGRGNPGDHITQLGPMDSQGESVQCKGDERPTQSWYHLRDDTTGAVGWVISCYAQP